MKAASLGSWITGRAPVQSTRITSARPEDSWLTPNLPPPQASGLDRAPSESFCRFSMPWQRCIMFGHGTF